MRQVDKGKLTEHLQTCIEISKGKSDIKVAEVLGNLKQDVEEGYFDVDTVES